MKKQLLLDEEFLNTIVKDISFVMNDINPKNIEKQLDEFDEDTIREIFFKILKTTFDSENYPIDSLRSFLEGKFKYQVVHISDFYKQLSEKFNGKYSPEELELICECEKNLAVNLLKTNDVVETKVAAFTIKYDKNCESIGINPALHSDFMEILKK